MRMMIAAVAAMVSTAAVAQDAQWQGAYVGVNAGGAFGGDLTRQPIPPQDVSGSPRFSGGLQAGYLYQVGKFVLGAEADFNATSVDAGFGVSRISRSTVPVSTLTVDQAQFRSQVEWFSTLRARLGYAILPGMLVYATGGAAFGEVSNSTYESIDILAPGTSLHGNRRVIVSGTSAGWTVGGGIEDAVTDRISLRAEYLYTSLSGVAPDQTPGVDDVGVSFSLARAGINYRF